MLDELIVENLGLIAAAHVEPGGGLVAVTGETGAGKTLLLGALRLLRGDPARADRVGPTGSESRIEGRFVFAEGEEMAVARRVGEGRSRAYLDGSMVPARILDERLGPKVEIVGQNEHVTIGRERTIRVIVDGRLDADGQDALRSYRAHWEQLQQLRDDREALGGDRHALERALDLSRHQALEISAAGLVADEEMGLQGRIERLRHAEEISLALAEAHRALADDGGAIDALGTAVAAARRASGFDGGLGALTTALEALAEEASEAAASFHRATVEVDQDPEALEDANRRLGLISDLRRKYGDTVRAVIEFGQAAGARADEIAGLLERGDSLDGDIARAEAQVRASGEHLSEARRRSAKELSERGLEHLRDLGFDDPFLDILVEAAEPAAHGADRCSLRFASDRALEPGPVGRIASGGELSRLVLSIRLAAGAADVPIVAFDEIDAGVGGATALAMGEKLAGLASDRQVLVVTHLPQVAAFADTHLVVDRDRDRATVRALGGTDRLEELTRMLGGLPESERGRQHAAELLELAANVWSSPE